ncbi:hypothetical protein [Xenorhabdus szentirmaii]|uniref:hypothetical protein n=1 Tax=Xenorhabdus szentirmaii TaxID=290112 RepID=UPI0019AA0C9C|nr:MULTISPECIES: hypothetical protein [unclassified Xenorhabdus]MBD2792997.1 hypothetical protein [Xenorhabdus sp. CUL]MBD2824456.1 hypothetical protein [Xenorhabdus sp. 5]
MDILFYNSSDVLMFIAAGGHKSSHPPYEDSTYIHSGAWGTLHITSPTIEYLEASVFRNEVKLSMIFYRNSDKKNYPEINELLNYKKFSINYNKEIQIGNKLFKYYQISIIQIL